MSTSFHPQLVGTSKNLSIFIEQTKLKLQQLNPTRVCRITADAVRHLAQDIFIYVMKHSSLPSLQEYKGLSQEYDK